jgi:hypothetical protein
VNRFRPADPYNAPLTRADRQRGLSLIGLLIAGVFVAVLALLGMRIVPSVIEFMAIKKAVVRAASTSDNPSEIRAAFERSAAIDDFQSVTGKDLKIAKAGDRTLVSFDYEKRIPLFGPASLVIEYTGASR